MPDRDEKAAAPASFALVLEPVAEPPWRIGGLPLSLRLALDAQAAGASAIVVPPDESELRSALTDPRLRLPIVTEPPSGVARLRAPVSLLVHRATFRELSQQLRHD